MWLQFFAQDFHFAINLLAALVFMAMGWLHFDAWSGHHARKELLKWTGFVALALSFLVQSTLIEQSVLGTAILGNLTDSLIIGLRGVAYLLIIIGQIIDPLQEIPNSEGLKPLEAEFMTKKVSPEPVSASKPVAAGIAGYEGETTPKKTSPMPAIFSSLSVPIKWILPFGGLAVAVFYWRRATTGLERHLKRVAYGFVFVALSSFVGLASLLRTTDNPILYSWVAAFGWVWLLEQLLLLVGVIILGTWVWSYLLKRFFSQLFMVILGSTVIVFFIVTVSLTTLLLRSIRSDALTNLETAASVLNYAIGAKKAETTAGAQQLAISSDVIQAVQASDHAALVKLTQNYLSDKKQSSLIITNESGKVLLRGQDAERWGDSISSDTLVKRVLLGEVKSSITAYQGVSAPTLQVRSAVPIYGTDGIVVGSVVTGIDFDSAFVDGIKQATGLQSTIYSGDTVAATTLTAPDGISRNVGVKLSDSSVTERVLKQGEAYKGGINVQNRELLGAFLPLKDVDNATTGMLLVSQQQSTILETAGRSIELTFLLTASSLIISVIPIYMITRTIEKQLE